MAKLTTYQALKTLLFEDQYLETFLSAGYTKENRRYLKVRLERNMLSADKMEEILQKCGFTIAVEKQWNSPTA